MKKLFLVDAYALIFKYYYAFLGRPMRNRAGMNTSVVFGFVKFLRDIQKRERPDLLGVAFDPKGGSFRREVFPEYKANRAETPEDILLSVPYVKRVLEAMCIPILEVEGYEADDVIGTLSQKGVEAGYEVFMVTPDKDYGQLVRDNCKIYKQKGADGSIEIVDRDSIREKYGIDDPVLVRDILALWGDASDNIPGVPGIGEKSACKLVQEWGTVENILDNVSKIKGKQGEKIAAWGDKLRLAKHLTTICLDVPIPFRPEDLTVCDPHIDELKAVFAELDFKAFMNDLTNLAPPETLPEGPRQEAQTQLAEMARAKSAAAKRAALVGQGNLFGDPVVEMPAASDVPAAELQAEAEAMQFKTVQTTPHDYRLVEDAAQLRGVVDEVGKYEEFCFDTETTGFDIFNDRIVGMSLAVKPFEAWYIPFKEENTAEYAEIVRPLFENDRIAKIGQNIKFDLMVLRQLGLEIRGRKYDTMILPLPARSRIAPQHERPCGEIPQLQADRDRNPDRQRLQAADDGSGERRAGQGVRRRGCRRDAAAQACALSADRRAWPAAPLFRNRGADDRRAGRHRDGGRADRLRGAGRLFRGAEPQAGANWRRRSASEAGEPQAEHQLGASAGRGAVRQNAHRREAQDDQNQAVLHRRGLPAVVCAQTPHRRSDPRIPGCQEAPFYLCRGAAPAGQPPHGAHPHLVQSGCYGYRDAFRPRIPTCRISPCATRWAAVSAGRSSPPTRSICCSRPTTVRSNCG